MIGSFTEVKPLFYWVQHILPLVYDDSLSYMELLGKVTKTLNELVENNNLLPDYIMKLIKEYISSGEIEKVLAEVLANYMLNVKFPPKGLTPAVGDGSADDTEAIQGCINYAYQNGGMAVYFPSGSYLTQPLTLNEKVTLFGQDRYTTRLVMKGGATQPMFTGTVDEMSLTGLGFDGNMDIQVNNVNLFTITVNSAIITNCLLTDGYDLLNITVNNELQLNNLLFRHAVENALVLKGNGLVQGENLIFKSVSTLVGKNFVVMGVSNSILEQVKCFGASPNGVLITGNNNVVKMWNEQSLTPYVDNGTNNSITVYTQSELENLTGNKTTFIGGNATETITGNKGVVAYAITETARRTRTENTSGDRNETTGGNATETVTGNKVVSSQNYNETVRADKVTTANKSTETVTTEKDFNANVSRETLDTKTVNVNGVSTENSGSKNETITGDKVVKAANITETVENKEVHAENIFLDPTNPLKYWKPDSFNNYFKKIDMVDKENNPYDLLVSNSKTTLLNSDYIIPEFMGAIGDGITDDTKALQDAVDYARTNGLKLCSCPNKIYAISSPIIITNVWNQTNYIDFGCATIKPLNNMESVIIIDGHAFGGFISNLYIDCDSKQTIGLLINDAMHISLHGFKISNVSLMAVKVVKGYEILFQDSEFIGVGSSAIGFEINTSDSVYFNLTLVNFHIAFSKTYSSNYFDHIHAWIADTVPPECVIDSIMFNVDGNYCTFESCETDTYHYTFKVTEERLINVSNMFFFVSDNVINNERTPNVIPTIFNATTPKATNSITVNQIYGYGAPLGQDHFCNTDWNGRASNVNLIGFTDIIHENFVGGGMPELKENVSLISGSVTKDSSISMLTLLLKIDNVVANSDILAFTLPNNKPAQPLTLFVGISDTAYNVKSVGYCFIDSETGNCTVNIPEYSGTVYVTLTVTYIYQNGNFS